MKQSDILYGAGTLLTLASCATVSAASKDSTPKRPNILVIVCEDISCYLGCYGDSVAITPNLDRFAKESVRHTRMFTCVGVSSPSRYSLITGRYSSTDGANYMRSNYFDKDFEVVPPAGVKCFTEYLRQAGYYCTNNSKTDYQFVSPLSAWDESSPKAHWKQAPEGVPFYAVFNLNVTHESMIWKNSEAELFVKPSDVVLPPYYPDTEVVRHDMAVMYSNITRMDTQFEQLYEELVAADKLENTIVIFYSDNGGPLPRGKREIMDSGTRVPFMIRFPDGYRAGTTNDALNMFVDIPATILSLAGVPIPANMHGKAMYGTQRDKPRKYVFGATDRFDEQVEKRASIRDKRYLYIKNYMPQQSVYRPNKYRLQMDMMRNMEELSVAGQLNDVQNAWFEIPSGDEQLFDCKKDPYNVHNLVPEKRYAGVLRRMRQAFKQEWIEKYNRKWVSYKESDFVREMNPEGKKPQCPSPEYKLKDGRLIITVDPDYSVVYKSASSQNWSLYSGPVPLKQTDGTLSIVVCRIGYRNSPQLDIDLF